LIKRLNAFHLNGLRAVEAVARLGSLQRAANELSVSASAVSQQVNRTEEQMGRALFLRTRNGLTPSDFGGRLAARLSSGFRELEEAVALATENPSNTLVVSVAPAFASRFLVPRGMRFYEAHPGILLRLDATINLVDFRTSDVDLAIRVGNGVWPNVRTEHLIDMDVFPVCAPSVAAGLTSIDDLANVFVLSDFNAMFSWDTWFAAAGSKPVKMREGAVFNDGMLCFDAAVGGQGVMLAWQMLVGDALADGRLVAPFGIRANTGLAHYFVTPNTRPEPRKVTLFKEWVRAEVERATLSIAGRQPMEPASRA